ncbi:hypothetical protein ABZP36_006906 [Zizania latifolia]
MDRRAHAALLILLGVAISLVGPVAGDMSVDAAVRHLVVTPPALASTRLEDAVAPELGVDMELHRRILAGSIRLPAL